MNGDYAKCESCGTQDSLLKLWIADSAFGCLPKPICKECYENEIASAKVVAKKFGYKCCMKTWAKLKLAGMMYEIKP